MSAPAIMWDGADALADSLVAIDSLEPWPGNPRRGDVAAVRGSLERFGQVRPIVVRGSRIVAGHHVVLGALEAGWTHVAVLDPEFASEDEARAFLLADNRTAELGFTDDALLAEQLAALRDLEGVGYSPQDRAELEARLALLSGPAPDDADAPSPPDTPESRLGERYEMGPHVLVCGDSRDPDVLALLMGDDRADLLFTDPPYGLSYQTAMTPEEARRRRRRTDGLEVENDSLSGDETKALVRDALLASKAYLRPGASFYVCSPPGPSALALALVEAGLDYRQQLVWVKDRFVLGRSDYHYRHEAILYGWTEGAAHRFAGGRSQDSVWEISRPGASSDHPTMKPVELVARAIRNSSVRGSVVLDPFAGSGTTLVAAEREGRSARLVELSPGYCDVVRRRYAAFFASR